MIHRKQITSTDSPFFASCWELYVDSFPANERRSLSYHTLTLSSPFFNFDAILDDDKLIGFISWWNFPDIRYIEHFATNPKIRGGGYGRRILEAFINESEKDILLEVEHPEDELKSRRIEFYRRLGFNLNHHEYFQPSYEGNTDNPLSLLVMTYPKTINKESLIEFKEKYFSYIHFI